MTTSNGKSADEPRWYDRNNQQNEESTEQSLPDYRQELVVRLRELDKKGYQPLTGAIGEEAACEIEMLRTSEREGWRYSAELEQECKRLTEELIQANATIAALQAKIDEADGQEPFSVLRCDSLELEPTPLFTRPPITSERELELQAKIKELEDFIALDDSMQADYVKMGERELELLEIIKHKDNALLATGIKWPVVLDALALTPDLSALNEHNAQTEADKIRKYRASGDTSRT